MADETETQPPENQLPETQLAETPAPATPAPTPPNPRASSFPLRTGAPRDVPPAMPARQQIPPEVVRRPRDYASADDRQMSSYGNSNSDGKRLIVGRDIALSGQISACERLVVEGRVEANMQDCREIDVAETGTFKGEADIEVAEISGVFEGSLRARELLIVRATGRVTGSICVGRLEVERGGELEGDIRVERPQTPDKD